MRYTPELASYLFGVNSFYALELDGIDAGLDYFLGYELDIRGQDLAILTEYGKMFVYYYRPVAISIETYLVYTLMRLVQTKSYEENEKVYDELLEYIHDVGKTMQGSLKNMIDNMTYNLFSQSANAKKRQIDDLKKEVGIKATELTTIDIQSRIDFMSNMLKTFNKKAIEDADLTPGDITKYLNDLKTHEELTMEAQKLLKNSESMKKTDNEEDKNKFIQDLSSTTKKIEELDSEMQPARKVIASGGGGRASKRGRKSVEPTPVATTTTTQTPVVDTPAPPTPPPASIFSFATQSTPSSPKSGPETSSAENKE